MDINRDNYEAFFLDFAEGNLSAAQEKMLNNFLRFNPDLADELKGFDLLGLAAEDVQMPGKDSLRKEIPVTSASVNALNFEMFSIAYLEGDLSGHQQDSFEAFLNSNADSSADFELLKRTYLEPESINFPKKNSLKKGRRTSIFNLKLIIPVAAAASIALFVLIKMEPITIDSEIASIPESTILSETADVKPETKKPQPEERAASIQIIRNSRASVPVSNLKEQIEFERAEKEKNNELQEQKSKRSSGIKIQKARVPELIASNDQITTRQLPLPTIHMSSLAITERVRHQLGRASGLMDEDDVFIWNLANQGIQEINKLTGSDMSLMASQDQEGSVSGFQFKSRLFNVKAPLSSGSE